MARIPFGKYVLTSDANNWVVVETRVRKSGERAGETVDVPVGYYPTIQVALASLLDLRLRGSDATSIRELRAEVERFRAEVEDAFRIHAPA